MFCLRMIVAESEIELNDIIRKSCCPIDPVEIRTCCIGNVVRSGDVVGIVNDVDVVANVRSRVTVA